MKTLESKETRAQGNDADNAQFSLCYRLNAGRPRGDRHFSFLSNEKVAPQIPAGLAIGEGGQILFTNGGSGRLNGFILWVDATAKM